MTFARVNKFLILISILFAIFACDNNGKRKLFRFQKTNPPSLIKNQILFSDLSNEYSFPVWFNDSLVKKYNIQKITRIIYSKKESTETNNDSLSKIPMEITEYEFDKNGLIQKVSQEYYFDDRKISQYSFSYTQKADRNGFVNVRVDSILQINDQMALSTSDNTEDFGLFSIYEIRKTNKDYTIYQNKFSGDFLFSIQNKDHWGPLDIDKLGPNPADKIILGRPINPSKIYQVENKVNETNVVTFLSKKGSIRSINKNVYPFHTNRYFNYDKRGYCIGFIDSTFSENSFLTRNVSNFENNMNFSPTRIYHHKENLEGKIVLINYEEIIYDYRK